MTRKIRSLQQSLRRKLLLFGVFLIFSMIAIFTVQFFVGVDMASDKEVELEVRSFARNIRLGEKDDVLTLAVSKVYRNWDVLPEVVREAYLAPEQLTVGEIVEMEVEQEGGLVYLFMLPYRTESGELIYWLGEYADEDLNWLVSEYVKIVAKQSVIGILFFVVVLFGVTAVWMRQLSRPFVHLSQWASKLGTTEQGARPSYDYLELNDLSEQLESAVDRIRAFNEREADFLRHASHELRTPLAILQISLDTLDEQHPQSRPLGRARKALDNMNTVSSTLLWLARESNEPLEQVDIDLLYCCKRLSEDLAYLQQQKALTTVIRGAGECHSNLPLVEIVLSNLIRNAFQYAEAGEITIEVEQSLVRIQNLSDYDGKNASGFGLGLELVKRICDKQGWQFIFLKEQQQVTVEVRFGYLATS